MIKENLGNMNIPSHVKLIAVTKTRTVEEINEAIRAGVNCIGENRVKEAEEKFNLLLKVEKHMIGSLQTNKVKLAVELFDMIQSVDSLKLAKEIDKRCAAIHKVMPVLIEVNIGNEKNKHGINPEDVKNFLLELSSLKHISVQGLMCVAPMLEPEQVRPYFKKMKQLFDSIGNLKWLSMGMSNDYKIAIEEGSNMVRIGTLLFGKRE
ncbi:YggS family pyridoxal phosphate-dependent enzyme [Candidatus Woesearchaeota archaeon]|nr:YggS family pyridoxal phosphate-dependent enzyme [Candidatus Woesearchaeota archaeon]